MRILTRTCDMVPYVSVTYKFCPLLSLDATIKDSVYGKVGRLLRTLISGSIK